jgi:hypothetical protein
MDLNLFYINDSLINFKIYVSKLIIKIILKLIKCSYYKIIIFYK